MKILFASAAVALTVSVAGCATAKHGHKDTKTADDAWGRPEAWFGELSSSAPADVFYLVSTNVNNSYDDNGCEVFNARLTPDELSIIDRELNYVKKNMFGDSLNFYSPRYHQVTMNGFNQGTDEYFNRARGEVLAAFNHYLKYENGGRPFVLAGFSQGAMMVLEILKNISKKDYSRMLAAYVIGYGISAEDAAFPYIKPACGPDDRGACYSHNTVTDTCYIWQGVYNNSICCINPANWQTDATPATFVHHGLAVSVKVDTLKHVLVASCSNEPRPENWTEGCLHVQDLLFFTPHIRRNALDRVYRKR